MSRAAPTVGATLEETLATAQPVPNIEGSDINDGWIIDRTQQLDVGNGTMKFAITLPDGSPFECTPFQIDQRRQMNQMWLGAVRAAIVERAGAAMEATRAATLRAQRDKQMASAGIQLADTMPTPEEAALLAKAIKAPPADPRIADEVVAARRRAREEAEEVPSGTISADPVEYAKAQLEAAEVELEHWTKLAQKAATKAKAAQKAALKWKTMLEAFSEDEEPAPAVVVERVVQKAPATRAGKLARTLQTSIVTTDI